MQNILDICESLQNEKNLNIPKKEKNGLQPVLVKITIPTCIPEPQTQSPTGIIGVGGGAVVIPVDVDDAVDVATAGGSGGLEKSAYKNL